MESVPCATIRCRTHFVHCAVPTTGPKVLCCEEQYQCSPCRWPLPLRSRGMFLCAWCCRCLMQELCFGEWPKKTDKQAELECTEESHEILCASRAFRILVAEKILLQFCKQSVVLLCCGRSTDAASVVILSLGVRKTQKMAVFGSRTRAIGTAR